MYEHLALGGRGRQARIVTGGLSLLWFLQLMFPRSFYSSFDELWQLHDFLSNFRR